MIASSSTVIDTILSGAALLVISAVAWFFRQWSNDLGEKVDEVKADVKEGRDSIARLDDKVDAGLQRTARLEGALGLPPWTPTSESPYPRQAQTRRRRA